MITKLHFSRFEFKYILPKGLRYDIESELAYFLQLDPFVASKPHKKYFVRSLYFDDPVFSHYYEKTDGMLRRTKFRLRTYSNNADERCATFLEIKGKYNMLVFKHRSPMKKSNGGEYIWSGGNTAENIISRTVESPVLQQFRYELQRKSLKPAVLIDYWRRPYISRYSPEFRLTFDDTLQGTRADSLHPERMRQSFSALRGYTVMEVKFRYHVPSWFHRIIQSYELKRVSISKYCKVIEVCRLASNLE